MVLGRARELPTPPLDLSPTGLSPLDLSPIDLSSGGMSMETLWGRAEEEGRGFFFDAKSTPELCCWYLIQCTEGSAWIDV